MLHLSRVGRWLLALVAAATIGPVPFAARADDDASAVELRLLESAKYLSSDALEGRGVGTTGLDRAADYLAAGFKGLGLKTELFDGGPFQKFKMPTSARLGTVNRLALVGPPGPDGQPRKVELKLGTDFNPLALGGSGTFDLPLAFVGYGITGKDEAYDDYAGIDVKGKAVVILRHEPQQDNPHSAFNGLQHSQHAPFVRKVSNAYEHGAGAVIFCNDRFDLDKTLADHTRRWQTAVDDLAKANEKFKANSAPTGDERRAHLENVGKLAESIRSLQGKIEAARDPIVPFDGAGEGEGRSFPVFFCSRAALEPVVASALMTELASLEKAIDEEPKPHSAELTGWRTTGESRVVRQEADVKNVVAVLEGQGPLSEETIVIGAHYDHLGFGETGSLAPGSREVHNGADDNASGAAALLEVARQLAALPNKLPRRVVFIAFTGEERGLIGSARYVREPLVPLDKTVAMLNMDMVGRLVDDKLTVYGTGTAAEFDALIDRLGKELGFVIIKKPGGYGPSDHSSFYAKKIPVLHFFTGNHRDYHRPSDDYEKLNVPGMRRVAKLVADTAVCVAGAAERPSYREVGNPRTARGGGDRPYFGSIPDFSQDQPGYALMGVTKDGPAERAGIKTGDIIVQLGESKIGNLEDFDSALRKHKAGDKVPVVVKRGDESVTVDVTLDPPR